MTEHFKIKGEHVHPINVSHAPIPFDPMWGYEGELMEVEKPGIRRVNRFWQAFVRGNTSGIMAKDKFWDHKLNPKGTRL